MGVLLRVLAELDSAWLALRRWRQADAALALTPGAGIQGAGQEVLTSDGVAWPELGSLAHSFWRAQELTLFRRHHGQVSDPILDLGCGDLVFGRMAGFPEQGVGVDYDWTSLQAGERCGSRLLRVRGDAGSLPLRESSLAGCVSNSVLEHLPDLPRCFAEVYRVLRPGGCFMFTMTLDEFTRQLRVLTGGRDEAHWTATFGHVQQVSRDEVVALLGRAGFTVEEALSYQPAAFTAVYRFLLSPVIQFVERRCVRLSRRLLMKRLTSMINASLAGVPDREGACLFVLARK
jgi:SAM-dependent methyltransferase